MVQLCNVIRPGNVRLVHVACACACAKRATKNEMRGEFRGNMSIITSRMLSIVGRA